MSLDLKQKPKYRLLPAGQKIIFTIRDDDAIANKFKVKYIAEVYVHTMTSGLTSSSNLAATLKVSPNSAGSGIFDLGSILESFVSPDYLGGIVHEASTNTSQYKQTDYSETTPHPIHLIDEFSSNRKSVMYFRVKFKIEYATAHDAAVITDSSRLVTSLEYLVFNGFVSSDDTLILDSSNNYGWNFAADGFIMNSSSDKFLTNFGTKHYLGENDYMTFGFFSQYNADFRVGTSSATYPSVKYLEIQFYYNGSTTGSVLTRNIDSSHGGHSGYMGRSQVKLQFAGVGTGNIVGNGNSLPSDWDYYTIKAFDDTDSVISDTYYLYKQENDCKGFEKIRLTWLNKFGVWDYYNFTKKSTRTLNSNRTTYKQIDGSWNSEYFHQHGYQGGNKGFKISTKEVIKINTDFISEDNNEWIEELYNSPDVYILHERSTDASNIGYIRKYVEPVIMKTSSHIKKTKANDKLVQYTFEIEKSKERKTQRI